MISDRWQWVYDSAIISHGNSTRHAPAPLSIEPMRSAGQYKLVHPHRIPNMHILDACWSLLRWSVPAGIRLGFDSILDPWISIEKNKKNEETRNHSAKTFHLHLHMQPINGNLHNCSRRNGDWFRLACCFWQRIVDCALSSYIKCWRMHSIAFVDNPFEILHFLQTLIGKLSLMFR